MEALLVSTGLVAVAEIGDKTQLLTLVLAARFRKPWAIVAGILVATILNHALAAWIGLRFANLLSPDVLRWVLGLSFLAMAAWALKPDTLGDSDRKTVERHGRRGVFAATTVAFFFAEMGDKTQVATAALAARFDALSLVVIGSTLGMLAANVPVAWLGDAACRRLPLGAIRIGASALFAALGVAALFWR